MSKKIGFIGLGIMGKPMVKNLLRAGCALSVYDIEKENVREICSMGAETGEISQIGSRCDIIFTMLPNGSIVKEVIFGENGLAASIKKGTVIVDMSSVTPNESKECAEGLSKLGAGFLDAPVSGGEPKAIDGTLAFMAGGREDVFELARPYFNIMGSSAVLVGDTGSGSATKLANQIIVNLTIAAVSEAFVLASKIGADPEKVYQAIRGGLAGSTVLDAKAEKIFNRDFAPGGKISINLKDIKNVMSTAHANDVPLPLTGMLLEIMQSLKVVGLMEEDHSAIVKFYEKLTNVEVKKIQQAE